MSATPLTDHAPAAGRTALDEAGGKALLASFGIPVPSHRVFEKPGGLAEAMRDLKAPLVLKVLTAHAIHKSDVGGVALGLESFEDVALALEDMQARIAGHAIEPSGWLLEEMAPPGVEMAVGGVIDPLFGPLVVVGLGGIFIEILKDVAVRICPIDRGDAMQMIESLRGAPLLHGARGRPRVQVDSVVDVLMRLGGPDGLLMQESESISELDINPLIAGPHGAIAVDARIVLKLHPAGAAV